MRQTQKRGVWLATVLIGTMGLGGKGAIAQPSPQLLAQQPTSLCGQPALSRLTRHRVATGETLASIANQYNLIPATILGFNPSLRDGNVPVGAELVIPPYNGVRAQVRQGSTWSEVAATYGTRADVLFEVNGCVPPTSVVFIPGVNWEPTQTTVVSTQPNQAVTGYPLAEPAPVITSYGWQLDPNLGEVAFHSGVDVAAASGTPVLAAGDGTVAFAGTQGAYGNLVVINHAQGLQTRYAQLDTIGAQVGQRVRRGDRIGTVGATGTARSPHLHFEVRSNSELGWVAQDPRSYVPNLDLSD